MNGWIRMLWVLLCLPLCDFFSTSTVTLGVNGAQIRLVNGQSRCSGRVEVYYNDQWGTVCDDGWTLANAEVVCRELGCPRAVDALGQAQFGKGKGRIWLDGVRCQGTESTLTQCAHQKIGKHDCSHMEDAGVLCAAILQKPSISISVVTDEVKREHRFAVTCSTESQLGVASFQLKVENSWTQTVITHNGSATFFVPPAKNYSCRYDYILMNRWLLSPESDVVTVPVDWSKITRWVVLGCGFVAAVAGVAFWTFKKQSKTHQLERADRACETNIYTDIPLT
ncbi:scavenger receptor cysteine-rich type 1 protein M130 [Amia ocellicauda]|uniref:scavenger receptor cysteine-rich type 1 protein M130 n=1 Tax=Amia ocellicauda TaxID=2972642 RepID=UPI003464A7D8